MLDSIIWFIFVVLILFGTVAICYMIMLKLLLSKDDKPYYVVIPCDESSMNVRQRAYGMRIKMSFINEGINCKIVILDYGINNQEKKELLPICKDCNEIYYVEKDKLKDFFNGRV